MAKSSGKQHSSGRPAKVGNVRSSRSKAKCFCCQRKRRKDKIIQHIKKHVIWVPDKNDNLLLPANVDQEPYIKASKVNKMHTDYLREKGYTSESFKLFVPLAKKGCHGPPDNFFRREDSSEEEDDDKSSSEGDLGNDEGVSANLESGEATDYVSDAVMENITPDPRSKHLTEESFTLEEEPEVMPEEECRLNRVNEPSVSVIVSPPQSSSEDERRDEEYEEEENYDRDDGELPTVAPDGNNNALLESFKNDIVDLFSNKREFESEGYNLSKVIAKRTAEIIKQREETQKALEEAESNYEEQGEFIVCKSCRSQALSTNCPSNLRKTPKASIGIFNCARPRDTRRCMTEHLSHPFHVWAVREEKREKKEKDEMKERNRKAGEMIVTNAIHCFKDASSTSVDFVRLNNKDQLNENIGDTFAFKNDGRQNYFYLRDVAFEKLGNTVKKMVSKAHVISVTLDKVTVGSTSYMVILTYFFNDGRIHAVLNEIHPMKSKELSGEGTADLVIQSLQKTLGMSEEELVEQLEHLVFDGVYEEPENRPRGGGSLSLVSHLTEMLQLGPGVISGTWDYGHRIQLVLHDCLKQGEHSKKYKETTDFMYDLMAKFREDKSSLLFKETADELNMAVLKNSKKCDTRWARKDLSSNVTFIRNAPTMLIVLGREAEDLRRTKNNTKLKQVLKTIAKLQDPSFWLLVLGYTQLLDIISEVSVFAQRVGCFPTSVFGHLMAITEELEELGKLYF